MKNNKPLVSVVIPTFNRAYCIKRALDSVLNQTYNNIEIIIIDNFSTDNTEEIINKLNIKNNIFFYKNKNYGIISRSRNFGLKKSSGFYIAFLDSDDWWKKNKIEISVQHLQNGNDIVYHDLFNVISKNNKLKNISRTRTRILRKPVFNDLLIFGNAINNSSVVLRKDYLNLINGFSEDESLVSSEDYDTWIRYSKITDKFYKINNVLGYYWKGGGNTSNLSLTIKSMNRILSIYEKDINRISSFGSAGFNYTISRSHYGASDYVNSIRFSSKVIFKPVPFVLRFKALITIIFSVIFYINYLIRK